MFDLDLIDLPKLVRIETGNGRKYQTPEGNQYPSVTTILGAMSDKTGLDEWRARVGNKEADKISRIAANRGTKAHELCEDLILNRTVVTDGIMPVPLSLYKQLERKLIQHVSHVRASELFLYSDNFKVAGATDLIANWDGKKSIIDFKTSGKLKRKEWIDGYFLQCALYSYMFWERTGLTYNQLVVLIAVEFEREAQVFVEDARKWLPQARDICKAFHLKN